MDKNIIVLIAEDTPNDLFLIQRALVRVGLSGLWLQAVTNVHEALAYMSGAGPYHDRVRYPIPHLILCDLEIPDGNGFMLVNWLREQPQFSELPVILVSSMSVDEAKHAMAKGPVTFASKIQLADDPIGFALEIKRTVDSLTVPGSLASPNNPIHSHGKRPPR